MDTSTIVLAVLVALAILLQLCLPLIGKWNRKRQERELARKRAQLLEQFSEAQLKPPYAKMGGDPKDHTNE